eukprot:15363445-Ditylum_brightwellii.AAC.1
MKQWITSNWKFIKYCLSIGLKQKRIHTLDIRDFIPLQISLETQINTDRLNQMVRAQQERKHKKHGTKQMDIRDG